MSRTKHDEHAIRKLLHQGRSVREVSIALDVPEVYIRKYFSHIKFQTWQKPLGSKQEPYYTSEAEMYERLHPPLLIYKDLSPSEKAIYDEMADDN
jgi:hypothetical protein